VAEILNRDELLDRVEGDLDLLKELVCLFSQEYPELVRKLNETIEKGEGARTRDLAHALKGSVSNFAIGPAFYAAKAMEDIGRGGDLSGAREAMVTLEQELKRLEQALEAVCSAGGPLS